MHRRRSGVVHVQLAAFQPIKLNHLLFLFFIQQVGDELI